MNLPATRAPLVVLLVDDSEPFVDAAKAFLEQLASIGRIEIAHSAQEAIVFTAHYRPDLVLMDYEMPGANGLEALRAIKSRTAAPRVIVMTLHDSAFLAHQAREAGADAFVAKSDFFDRFPRVVQRLFPL